MTIKIDCALGFAERGETPGGYRFQCS
jgi:hypothetical protein